MKRNAKDPSALTHDMATYQREWARVNRTPEYRAWRSMKSRCLNPNAPFFEHYGGRGISVCESWLDSYQTFLADMGARPSASHSLDRVDVNGNYEPANCRWATAHQQSLNRRRQRNNKTGIVGVTREGARWRATYCRKYLGMFDTADLAAAARREAELAEKNP